jgi:hypothetical protein
MRTIIDRFSVEEWRNGDKYVPANNPILLERVNTGDGRGNYYDPAAPGGAEPDIEKAPTFHLSQLDGFNGQCKIILFTEETKEQKEARLAAFTPTQRLFYELQESPARKSRPGLSLSALNIMNKSYGLNYEIATMDNVPHYVFAFLMCLSSDVRNLMTSLQRANFDEAIKHVHLQLKETTKNTPTSSKICNAFNDL